MSGSLKFTGDKDSGRFVIFDGDKATSSGWRDMAYMKTDWKGHMMMAADMIHL